MTAEKSFIREKYSAIRNSISAKKKSQLDTAIINHLIPLCAGKKVVSIFYPIKSEINLLSLYNLKPDIKFLFPRIENDILLFYHPQNISQDFEYNKKYTIYEPSKTSEILIPEIIICPMLSFDSNMNRLGYGGGFYDRSISFLRKTSQITYVGVAYDAQQSVLIPTSPQDQPLDMIVTENGII